MVKRKGEQWVKYSDVPAEDLGGNVTRRVLAYGEDAMAVENSFETGAIGAMHCHPHTQITYIISGKFDFTIGEETRLVEAGDTLLKEDGVMHGCVCLEKGALIDFFSPMRKEFVEEE